MRREDLVRQAETCRVQADHFREPERRLLLRMAKVFDRMASMTEVRRAVDATRCW